MKFRDVMKTESEKIKYINNDNSSLVAVNNTKAFRKVYKNYNVMKIELDNYKTLFDKGVSVPNIILVKDNIAYIQWVEGISYVDIIERIEQGKLYEKSISKVANELCHWLESFYEATNGMGRGDVNLSNFIFSTLGKCVSVNFKNEFESQDKEVDMGRILAYTATYEPALTQGKLSLCKAFYKNFLDMGADEIKIHTEYIKQINYFEQSILRFKLIKDSALSYYDLIVK